MERGEAIEGKPPIRIAALYRFTRFADCAAVRDDLTRVCADTGIKGTLLIAPEGINGTIAGTSAAMDHALAHIQSLPGCADLEVKTSFADRMPFHRMKVRIKREIVTMSQPDIDPLAVVGHYVAPADWNALIAEPGTILIDTRNDYEVAVGSFAGAIDPKTKSFREFPDWFRTHREDLLGRGPPPKVAMFCTGGIRCEKATAFLRSEGLEQVYHLNGGILKYLESVPVEQSLWTGECFVFDERVAVGPGLSPGTHELCRACRTPVNAADRASDLYVAGISCPACHATRTEVQRAGYAERERQTRLADARGIAHVGATSKSAKKAA